MDTNKKETIIAFIRLACMLAASGLTMLGIAVDAEAIYVLVGLAVSLAAAIWAWWKNNNVTAAASEAQEFYELFKNTKPEDDIYEDN